MGEGDVRTPERWDDLDTAPLEFRPLDDDNLLEPLQLRLTDGVDLGFVVGGERRDAVLAPGCVPSVKPQCISAEDVGPKFVAAHNKQHRSIDGRETDAGRCLSHISRILIGCSLYRRRGLRRGEAANQKAPTSEANGRARQWPLSLGVARST